MKRLDVKPFVFAAVDDFLIRKESESSDVFCISIH